MRHIKYDPSKIEYPDGWLERAEAARKAVESAAPDKRADEIKKYSDLWAALKPKLLPLSNGKCWYTEAPQFGTDIDVDHFRPKNSVKGVTRANSGDKHLGYWWRAFEPENYRISCIVANRPRRDLETGELGGKHDEFPLWDEKCRAWCPDDDCDDEQPLLIDPCNAAEVALITFGENGEATIRHSKNEKPKSFAKADCSIKLYHINHSDFVKARIAIRDELKKHMADAKRFYKRLETGDAQIEHSYRRAIEALRDACNERAPFSSFAVAILQAYRADESLDPVFR